MIKRALNVSRTEQSYHQNLSQDLNSANQGTNAVRRWQWNGTWANGDEDAMMLNTDFEVFYELQLNEDAEAGCDVQSDSLTCAKSETYDKAKEYAEVSKQTAI